MTKLNKETTSDLENIKDSLDVLVGDLYERYTYQKQLAENYAQSNKALSKQLQTYKYDLEEISYKYTELTDLLVEQRELLSLEFLDKQSPHAIGAVVGSPADIIYYANIYIKELQEKLNNEHK